AQVLELIALLLRTELLVGQVLNRLLLGSGLRGAAPMPAHIDRRSLESSGQKSGTPITHAAMPAMGIDSDEARQILIFRAEPVQEPRTIRRPRENHRPRV